MSNSSRLLLATLTLFLLGLGLIGWGLKSGESDKVVPEASQSASNFLGQPNLVKRVIDGDTIEVEIDNQSFKVRYIGIDTPETVDPRRPVGCFGKEASLENQRLVGGKEVFLVKDISETDKFGRLLRYAFIKQDDGSPLLVNDYLIRNGYALLSTFPPDVKYVEQFREAEREAREEKRGLWQKCKSI